MRVLSTFEMTEGDLPARCAYCGCELAVGDEVFDICGDLYHAACWSTSGEIDWWREEEVLADFVPNYTIRMKMRMRRATTSNNDRRCDEDDDLVAGTA